MIKQDDIKIAVIGMGYVGLPLSLAFGKKFATVGFDINHDRIASLNAGHDVNNEASEQDFISASKLSFSAQLEHIANCNVYIITVPTPIDSQNMPDLGPMRAASTSIAQVLARDNVVIYESTVYPGAVEEVCVPILTSDSGLEYNKDFFVGYSPERINPGDKQRTIADIIKITSGSTPEAASFVDNLYKSIITAGTHPVSSIQVAEAAKVIENTQRDLNIALVNELAIIFNRVNIDTKEVLQAAGTKWNFIPFKPGLVGGHCIGVDPYYLTYKAKELGYYPQVILSGRRINDNMGKYIASELIKLMLQKRIHVLDANILIMGLTFKENCPDTRNSKVFDIITELEQYGAKINIYDPHVPQYKQLNKIGYDSIVLAVAHDQFLNMTIEDIRRLGNDPHVLYDVKRVFAESDGGL